MKKIIKMRVVENFLLTILISITICLVCFACFYVGEIFVSKEFHEFINNTFFQHIEFIYIILFFSTIMSIIMSIVIHIVFGFFINLIMSFCSNIKSL